jgi:hypothetical protein
MTLEARFGCRLTAKRAIIRTINIANVFAAGFFMFPPILLTVK